MNILDGIHFNWELLFWPMFAGACYRLREFGDIWANWARFPFMEHSDWWMNRTDLKDKWYHEATFYIFIDSYHFFGNLARIAISVRFGYSDLLEGILLFIGWYIGETYMKKAITK